jgi:hypothetical protein
MGKINCGKLALGGIVAGIIMNVIDFVVNGVFLGNQWMEATKALGKDPAAAEPMGMIGWIAVDMFMGFFLVWLYAAIRPRYGAGPKTALRASLALWTVALFHFSSYWFMGLYPVGLVLSSCAGGLLAVLAGGMAGCWLYKEA